MERPLIEYPKRKGLRSKARKLGVCPLRKNEVQNRDLLILGSGRSGTTTIAKMFQSAGIDLQHEKVGGFGTASLYFNVDSDWHPAWPWYKDRVHLGERRSDFKFRKVMQIVRHPALVIPSMGAIFPALNYEFFEDNRIIPHGISKQLLRCALAYYQLNKLAEAQTDFRFRVEDVQKEWNHIMRCIDYGGVACPPVLVKNKASGFRKRPPLDWHALRTLDPTLCRAIQHMGRRYGYDC